MNELKQVLEEIKDLHERTFGFMAPSLGPQSFLPFPPGVDPIEHARDEVRQLKKLAERAAFAPRADAWVPPADMFVGPETFVVRIDIPGISREDVDVHIVGQECIVRGERKPPQCAEESRPMVLESPWGKFERRFPLPVGARVDGMTARFSNGLLELLIPTEKKEELADEKRIEIT